MARQIHAIAVGVCRMIQRCYAKVAVNEEMLYFVATHRAQRRVFARRMIVSGRYAEELAARLENSVYLLHGLDVIWRQYVLQAADVRDKIKCISER